MRPMMGGYCALDQIAAKTPEARERSVLVGACKTRVADDIGHDRRGLLGLAHPALQ
jgi:hypothetical protein